MPPWGGNSWASLFHRNTPQPRQQQPHSVLRPIRGTPWADIADDDAPSSAILAPAAPPPANVAHDERPARPRAGAKSSPKDIPISPPGSPVHKKTEKEPTTSAGTGSSSSSSSDDSSSGSRSASKDDIPPAQGSPTEEVNYDPDTVSPSEDPSEDRKQAYWDKYKKNDHPHREESHHQEPTKTVWHPLTHSSKNPWAQWVQVTHKKMNYKVHHWNTRITRNYHWITRKPSEEELRNHRWGLAPPFMTRLEPTTHGRTQIILPLEIAVHQSWRDQYGDSAPPAFQLYREITNHEMSDQSSDPDALVWLEVLMQPSKWEHTDDKNLCKSWMTGQTCKAHMDGSYCRDGHLTANECASHPDFALFWSSRFRKPVPKWLNMWRFNRICQIDVDRFIQRIRNKRTRNEFSDKWDNLLNDLEQFNNSHLQKELQKIAPPENFAELKGHCIALLIDIGAHSRWMLATDDRRCQIQTAISEALDMEDQQQTAVRLRPNKDR